MAVTSKVKKALYEAFQRAGGQEYRVGIGQEQPAVFCRMLAKLIPSELKIHFEEPQVTLHLRDYMGLSAKEVAESESANSWTGTDAMKRLRAPWLVM